MEKITKVEICPKCGLPMPACVCGEIAKTQQQITVKTEKRRFGKVNTIISGFDDGVDTKEISSKTMESSKVSNLYFIGEVVDVTGHLGGHNFQWAWASAVAAGEAV